MVCFGEDWRLNMFIRNLKSFFSLDSDTSPEIYWAPLCAWLSACPSAHVASLSPHRAPLHRCCCFFLLIQVRNWGFKELGKLLSGAHRASQGADRNHRQAWLRAPLLPQWATGVLGSFSRTCAAGPGERNLFKRIYIHIYKYIYIFLFTITSFLCHFIIMPDHFNLHIEDSKL